MGSLGASWCDSGRFPAAQRRKPGFWCSPGNPETALAGLWWGETAVRQSYGNRRFSEMRGEAKSPYRLSFLTGSGPEGFNRRR